MPINPQKQKEIMKTFGNSSTQLNTQKDGICIYDSMKELLYDHQIIICYSLHKITKQLQIAA